MTKTHAKRLLKLADFLDALPRERFAIHLWADGAGKKASDISCGTVGCAIGWATTMPEFRKLGLRLRRTSGGNTQPYLVGMRYRHDRVFTDTLTAVERIFGVRPKDFDRLFTQFGYGLRDATPKMVARKLRTEAGQVSGVGDSK